MNKLVVSQMLRKFTFFVLIVCVSLAYASKPKSIKAWEKCRDKAEASVNINEFGMAGIEVAINDMCGPRPTVKTKSSERLLKTDCDWLYNTPLQECVSSSQEQCDGGVDALSMASSRGLDTGFSPKVFNFDTFNEMCKQVCLSKRVPNRKSFGQMFCGGS